jgi:hypothetical protein
MQLIPLREFDKKLSNIQVIIFLLEFFFYDKKIAQKWLTFKDLVEKKLRASFCSNRKF